MSKRVTKKSMATNAAEAPLTKADFEAVMVKVFERFEQVDKRFDQVDQRFEQVDQRFEQEDQRFEQVDKRFEQVDDRITFEVTRQRALLEEIRAEIRTANEGYRNEATLREKAVERLRNEVIPRLESVEEAVRTHSAQLLTKADKSLEARVDALEADAKR